jgi:hypothetical protein
MATLTDEDFKRVIDWLLDARNVLDNAIRALHERRLNDATDHILKLKGDMDALVRDEPGLLKRTSAPSAPTTTS